MLPCGGKRRRMPHARREAGTSASIRGNSSSPKSAKPDWPASLASPSGQPDHIGCTPISGIIEISAVIGVNNDSISQYTDIGVNIANKKLGMDCGDENQWSDDDAQSARR